MVRRPFAGGRLVIASHNSGKVAEIAALLSPYAVTSVPAAALGICEPPETGATFEENAALKARHSARRSGLPALADDSGLVVPALGGMPGIYSARWAGPERDFRAAMQKVHDALGDKDRAARFVAVLALAWPDGHCECFRGEVAGRLVWPPRGEHGFGYDPMFVPAGHRATFGELGAEGWKHRISHRARAFEKFAAECLANGDHG